MPTIAEVRAQFPQYRDMPDNELADALHRKFYADMPRDQFAKKIGLGTEAPVAVDGDYAKSLVKNIPGSAVNMATDIAHAVAHPVETVENIGAIGKGVLQKFGMVSGNDSEKYADAVGKFFADRYGGWDNVKKTLRDDPVGALADLSTVLTAGGAVGARAPGVAGRVGQVVADVGRTVDPLNAAASTARGVGHVAAGVTGFTTGAGGEAVRTAARAGAEGGAAAQAFRDGMTGEGGAQAAVAEARAAVQQIRAERGTTYRQGMAQIGADNTVLDFNHIDDAIRRVQGVKNYRGQDLSPTTQAIRDDIAAAVNNWRQLDPAQFHTPEGLDALKQLIGDLRDGTQHGTPERVIADQAYRAVRQTIVNQAPEYAQVMRGYEEASTVIREIERTLSINPRATIDTSLRKLQSVLRDNVNTNYGRRGELLEFLSNAGAPHLMERLAGQALSAVAPRGLSRVVVGGEGAGALTAVASGHPATAAALGGSILASSPRLVGEAAYGMGVASRAPFRGAGNTSFQLGRADRALQ